MIRHITIKEKGLETAAVKKTTGGETKAKEEQVTLADLPP